MLRHMLLRHASVQGSLIACCMCLPRCCCVCSQAFQSFDPEYKGRIRASEFRRVLDNFCFPLSEPQFKHLLTKLQVHADNQVDYTAFVADFKEPETVRDDVMRRVKSADKTCMYMLRT